MENKTTFGSRLGFIMAALGMAVGTGNIWRFPRVAAANGGAAFIIALTVAVFVWAVPLLIGEMVMARKTGLGPIGAARDFMGRKFTWVGGWITFVCLGIMFYYSVCAGWTIKYFTLAVSGGLSGPNFDSAAVWNEFLASPAQGILFHAIAMGIGAFVIVKGITDGIEKVTTFMVPSLCILLLVVAIRAITLPGATLGLEYLFNPDLSILASSRVWLEAFTQAAWSTGAGWGLLMAYAAYTKDEEDLGVNCFMIGFGDCAIALLAGMAVLPTVFSLSPTVEAAKEALGAGNNGLTFIYLTSLFNQMPGGRIFASLFFLALAFAALTSLFSMIEVGVINLVNAGMSRKKATLWTCGVGFLAGIPSAVSINFFDNQDWVWGVALLISGLLVSVAMMRYGVEKARQEDINHPWADIKIGKWWSVCIRLFPVMFIIVFGWWVWQSITWYPDNWWAPFETFSPGNMVLEWAILFALVYLGNDWLASKIGKGKLDVPATAEKEAK